MKYFNTLLLSTLLLFGFNSYSQQFTQTVRGTIIDLDASILAGQTVRSTDYLGAKGDNIFYVNLGVTYRVDMKRASHSFKIDIQNASNYKAVVSEYYNSRTESIEQSVQLPMIPNVVYTLKF